MRTKQTQNYVSFWVFILSLMILLSGFTANAGTDKRSNSDPPGTQEEEISIAVDPNNSNIIVVINMEDQYKDMGISHTNDGGVNWFDTKILFNCNGFDDDGDSFIDEEVNCDGIDDDGDLLMDEDPCCAVVNHIDPSIAADASGTFYGCMVVYDPNATGGTGFSRVMVSKSVDGGVTWSNPVTVDWVMYTFGGPIVDFLDKAYMTVDNYPGSPFSGHVYAVWQRDDIANCKNTNIYFSQSSDGGLTWSVPLVVNDAGFSCYEAPIPAVAPDGSFYVAWIKEAFVCSPNCGGSEIWMDKADHTGISCDGQDNDIDGLIDEERADGLDDDFDGSTDEDTCDFGVDSKIVTYNQIPHFLQGHFFKTKNFVTFTVDPFNPVVLYLAYSEDPPGADEADMMFTRSLNGGSTWTPPMLINDDPPVQPQYFPWMTVQRDHTCGNGAIDIIWYDERNSLTHPPAGCDGIDNDIDGKVDEEWLDGLDDDGDGLFDEDICDIAIDVYHTRSVDQGATFYSNQVITDQPFHYPAVFNFLGDYIGVTSDSITSFAAWTDTRNGDNDIYFDTIPESDNDGVSDGCDCAPFNGGVWRPPLEVLNVALAKVTASTDVTVSWSSQDAIVGPLTNYDIVSGLLLTLQADKDYRNSSCLVNDHPNTPYTDTRGNPTTGDGHYYLVRAQNVCGTATYGDSTLAVDPRDGLEDGMATPPAPDPCP